MARQMRARYAPTADARVSSISFAPRRRNASLGRPGFPRCCVSYARPLPLASIGRAPLLDTVAASATGDHDGRPLGYSAAACLPIGGPGSRTPDCRSYVACLARWLSGGLAFAPALAGARTGERRGRRAFRNRDPVGIPAKANIRSGHLPSYGAEARTLRSRKPTACGASNRFRHNGGIRYKVCACSYGQDNEPWGCVNV